MSEAKKITRRMKAVLSAMANEDRIACQYSNSTDWYIPNSLYYEDIRNKTIRALAQLGYVEVDGDIAMLIEETKNNEIELLSLRNFPAVPKMFY